MLPAQLFQCGHQHSSLMPVAAQERHSLHVQVPATALRVPIYSGCHTHPFSLTRAKTVALQRTTTQAAPAKCPVNLVDALNVSPNHCLSMPANHTQQRHTQTLPVTHLPRQPATFITQQMSLLHSNTNLSHSSLIKTSHPSRAIRANLFHPPHISNGHLKIHPQ